MLVEVSACHDLQRFWARFSVVSPTHVSFEDLCGLLRSLGFYERIRGSHHIFSLAGVDEIVNLQPKGAKAKPYQVKQVRDIIINYKLGERNE
jgi:predicted RNA binding protein YcfA (HicA-like mRNA interferase family)